MLEGFKELYKASVPVSKLKPLGTEEYEVFSVKVGLPVGLVDTKKHLEFLPLYDSFYSYFTDVQRFWMIPCATPEGKIYGFVLRGFSKKAYRVFVGEGTPQLVFGFEAFKDFKRGEPIVLAEGSKDGIYLQQVYPYTLAVLTNAVSEDLWAVLETMTNRIVVAFDSNYRGKKGAEEVRKQALEKGMSCGIVKPFAEDWGNQIHQGGLLHKTRVLLKPHFR